MVTEAFLLSAAELRLLAGLIGQTWDHYGGQAMDRGEYAIRDAFIRTDRAAITVSAELVVRSLEGIAEEYSILGVHAGATGEQEARRSGSLHPDHSGMRIESILIVRDSVTGLQDGVSTFVAVGDMGVVFVLDGRASPSPKADGSRRTCSSRPRRRSNRCGSAKHPGSGCLTARSATGTRGR